MPERIKPGPGQESVWDYPRPPRLEGSSRLIEVYFNQVLVAKTRRSWRVLETSHPPVYYIPPEDIRLEYLQKTSRTSFCEWKGQAAYYQVVVGERRAELAAWYYPHPAAGYEAIRDHAAFYAGRMDVCKIDGEIVVPQSGNFYGGWITQDIVGPFKGEPGTMGW